MNNTFRLSLLLTGIIICFGFAGKLPFLKDEDTVPPDLGKESTTILLLETPRKKVNKDMQEVFEKNYSGTVEMIDKALLNSGSYKDSKNTATTWRQVLSSRRRGDGVIPVSLPPLTIATV